MQLLPGLTLARIALLACTLACATAPGPIAVGVDAEDTASTSGESKLDSGAEAGEQSVQDAPAEIDIASSPDGEPGQSAKVEPQAHSQPKGALRRHAESGVEGMIIGTVLGGQIGGPTGAAVGAAAMGLYGLITGDVPFDSGRGSTAPGSRRGQSPDAALDREIEEELGRQEELESEVEAELRRQEELLAAIGKQEQINDSVRKSQEESTRSTTPSDPLAAPGLPYERNIPDSIFDKETREVGKARRIVKTLDADRDGRSEIELIFDERSGELLERSEDTDYDGMLDAHNHYEKGKIVSRTEDTNQDGKLDRWVDYENGQGTRVRVDRDFDGSADAEYVYRDGTLAYEEHDTNRDGVVDRRVEYEGKHRSVEIEDRNHDGNMDFRTFYAESGVPVRTEADTSGDGKTDVWEFYEGKTDARLVLVRKEEDVDSDGDVDVTSHYKNGKLHRKEVADPEALLAR